MQSMRPILEMHIFVVFVEHTDVKGEHDGN